VCVCVCVCVCTSYQTLLGDMMMHLLHVLFCCWV